MIADSDVHQKLECQRCTSAYKGLMTSERLGPLLYIVFCLMIERNMAKLARPEPCQLLATAGDIAIA